MACGRLHAQTAVDAKHKLIVAFERTNEGTTCNSSIRWRRRARMP